LHVGNYNKQAIYRFDAWDYYHWYFILPSVCILPLVFHLQSAFYPSSAICSLHFTLSLNFTPSLQSVFYKDHVTIAKLEVSSNVHLFNICPFQMAWIPLTVCHFIELLSTLPRPSLVSFKSLFVLIHFLNGLANNCLQKQFLLKEILKKYCRRSKKGSKACLRFLHLQL